MVAYNNMIAYQRHNATGKSQLESACRAAAFLTSVGILHRIYFNASRQEAASFPASRENLFKLPPMDLYESQLEYRRRAKRRNFYGDAYLILEFNPDPSLTRLLIESHELEPLESLRDPKFTERVLSSIRRSETQDYMRRIGMRSPRLLALMAAYVDRKVVGSVRSTEKRH